MPVQFSPGSEHERLIRKLEAISPLDDRDRGAIRALPLRVRDIGNNKDLIQQGEVPTECCFVVAGLVFRYKIMGKGRRQILSFHIPGDFPDLQSFHLDVMDHAVGTLTPCRAAFIPHSALRALMGDHPRIATILARYASIDASIFREWLANVGRRSAYERVAHLICEMFVRLDANHMAPSRQFTFPITQAEYGDALGLSYVHVNRSIKLLRQHGLITTGASQVKILDWPGLQSAADFSPAYLHLSQHRLAS